MNLAIIIQNNLQKHLLSEELIILVNQIMSLLSLDALSLSFVLGKCQWDGKKTLIFNESSKKL